MRGIPVGQVEGSAFRKMTCGPHQLVVPVPSKVADLHTHQIARAIRGAGHRGARAAARAAAAPLPLTRQTGS